MSKFIYLSVLLLQDIVGGGELSDHELCHQIELLGHDVDKIRCKDFKLTNINTDSFYIISNFVSLDPHVLNILQNNCNYIIYEHDHKYIKSRNPALYINYEAPEYEKINLEFYKKAKMVFCQSSFHKNIISTNIDIDNLFNVSGNLWSDDSLEIMRILSKKEKNDCYSILDSRIGHKNTRETVYYCEAKKLPYRLVASPYRLVASPDYQEFLSLLSDNDKFIFLPKTPETLSRVVVEARMMNIKTVTNKRVGASHETWFNLKGEELIDLMYEKKNKITKKVLEIFHD